MVGMDAAAAGALVPRAFPKDAGSAGSLPASRAGELRDFPLQALAME